MFYALKWLRSNQNAKSTPSDKVIIYAPADYDEDILQNSFYLSLDRDLIFGTPLHKVRYNYEIDRQTASVEAGFFMDYFNCLIHGDEEGILEFFIPGYFEEKPHFTMQKIHDMEVTLHSVEDDTVDGEEKTVFSYTVSYEIFKNNGTWRQGVGSDDGRPQIYQLILDEDGQYKIWRILEVDFE